MKSDIVLRIEKALKEYTPSKIDGVRIATARGILTAYEIAVKNGLSEAGKVDCIKVCESFLLPPITYGITNPITKKAATKVTPAVDKYMLAWSAVKGRYINSSVSNKKVNSAAIVECKGFKVRERQI